VPLSIAVIPEQGWSKTVFDSFGVLVSVQIQFITENLHGVALRKESRNSRFTTDPGSLIHGIEASSKYRPATDPSSEKTGSTWIAVSMNLDEETEGGVHVKLGKFSAKKCS
jgi:hypothetical protein